MTKEERRAAMPLCTAFIDDIREHLGNPAYIKASENGHEIEWGVSVAISSKGTPLCRVGVIVEVGEAERVMERLAELCA